jgi:branched-chain amino acid transport system substrate-binding protein
MENRLDTPSSERSALSRRGLLGAAGATGLAAGMLAAPGVAGAKSTRVGRRSATDSYTIGCSFPLTGPLASDGEQMKNGVTLAAAEINEDGGVAGKKINLSILDTDVTDPAKIKTSLQKHVNDKVDALYEGYLIQWPASMDIKANYGAPSLNASTSLDQVKQIAAVAKYKNIFQIDPPESFYGLGFPGFLSNLKKSGKWKPANNQIFIVEGDSVYSQTISKFAQQQAPKDGWKIKGVKKVTSGAADWSPSAKAAKDSKAAVVMVTHFDPNDLAKWTKAWAANPGKALVYLQYGPSIPAYTKLAGNAANGIIWATVTGVYNDPVGKIFRSAYQAKFNANAGFSNSGSGYDGVHMLARAWGVTGDGQNFKANIAQLNKMIHRGVNGGYWLRKNAGLAYPAQTADPGIAQAHLFFQIQKGVHHIIQPAPYIEASYTNPSWI